MRRKVVGGWQFRNESDCFDFLDSAGRISSLRVMDWSERSEEGCCPAVWDGFLCWPPAPLSSLVEQPCPANIPQLNHQNFALRNCSAGGWLLENGTVDPGPLSPSFRPLGYTDFHPCFDKDVIDVVKGFFNGSEGDIERKILILSATRILELVGYSLSLLSIALSLFILAYFRVLRTQEKRIHFHLYLAMLVQLNVSSPRSGWSIDCSSTDTSHNETVTWTDIQSPLSPSPGHTVAACQLSWILLEYSRSAMFHWMFLEGLHLHNILVVNVFLTNTSSNQKVYLLIGWLAPLLTTTLWAGMAFLYMDHKCWFGYNHKPFYWISEGPRLVIILVNSMFLINIIRMLYTKAGSQINTQEPSPSQLRSPGLGSHVLPFDPVEKGLRTSVKAAVVLQPLLGITNILQIIFNPYNSDVSYFTFWSITTAFLASFQGFFAALFYCFCNKEVQKTVRHSLLVQTRRRQTQSTLPARSESIRTTRLRLSLKRSSVSQKKRPSWCQEVPSTTLPAHTSYQGEELAWSPRGRSIDLRSCGALRVINQAEDTGEVQVQALSL